MTNREAKYFNIVEAKRAYLEGENIAELLRKQKKIATNTPEIIEVAYDLQAGTSIDYVEQSPAQPSQYAAELASILDQHLNQKDSLLDIGTGELTTLSLLTARLSQKPEKILAFDVSWSRLYRGLDFAKKTVGADFHRLTPFVAEIGEIPLPDKSVCITTSSYALEPNGGKLDELMSELFRVTSKKLVLFEPCYEINTEEGKRRMDEHGYIKDVDGVVEKLGGKVVDKIRVQNSVNPLNPAVCFVVIPPAFPTPHLLSGGGDAFSVPGTNHPLKKLDDFYFSSETGLCFPVLKSIPILRSSAAILASALTE